MKREGAGNKAWMGVVTLIEEWHKSGKELPLDDF